jgi:hypothetical protein
MEKDDPRAGRIPIVVDDLVPPGQAYIITQDLVRQWYVGDFDERRPTMVEKVRDAAERALWTGVQTGLGVLVVTDVSTVRTAVVAAVGAVLSVVKSFAKDRLEVLKAR